MSGPSRRGRTARPPAEMARLAGTARGQPCITPHAHFYCAGTALVLYWSCTGTALVLHWDCTGTALILHKCGLSTSEVCPRTTRAPLARRCCSDLREAGPKQLEQCQVPGPTRQLTPQRMHAYFKNTASDPQGFPMSARPLAPARPAMFVFVFSLRCAAATAGLGTGAL